MTKQQFISTEILCVQYNIEFSFLDALTKIGLITIEVIEQHHYIHQAHIGDLEKMIRLHNELNVNPEGIDVVFNLLEKEMELRKELDALKNRLRLYESD